MSATRIEWADLTVNPITGCTPISEGCANCYAKRMANRLGGRYGYPLDKPFQPGVFHPLRLEQIRHAPNGTRVFIGSMGDLFHERADRQHLGLVLAAVRDAPQTTFLMLTKRPASMAAHLRWFYDDDPRVLSNLWLGVTAENQRCWDERLEALGRIPAALRFVSVEPMLERIDPGNAFDPIPPGSPYHPLDWVICGAETGPGARPMALEWACDLRAACKASGTPFFFKKPSPGQSTPPDLQVREVPACQP